MLWLFGQIWLWLLAAFGLGVLLTWLVLGAVHRKQLAEAEAAALPPLEPPADDYDNFADLRDDPEREEPYLHTHPADAYEQTPPSHDPPSQEQASPGSYEQASSGSYGQASSLDPYDRPSHDSYGQTSSPDPYEQPSHDSYGQTSSPDPYEQPSHYSYGRTPPSPYGTPVGPEADYPGELHPATPYPPLHANDGYPRDDQGYPAEEYDYGYPAEDEDADRAYRGQLNGAARPEQIDWPVEHAQPEWPTDEDWPPAEPRRRDW